MISPRFVLACVLCCLGASLAIAQRPSPVSLRDPAGSAGDQFGSAVAIDGDTAVLGSPLDDVGGRSDQGSVRVFRWNGTGWTLEATLTASDGQAADTFGAAVAIYGDTIIVGSPGDDIGSAADRGSAYFFVRTGTTWIASEKLLAPDGLSGDRFGDAVAIDGDTVVVGAPSDDAGLIADHGSAYVYARTGGSWGFQQKLTAPDGAMFNSFGDSVAVSGETALVGAPFGDGGGFGDQGVGYVYVRDGGAWTLQAKLAAPDGAGFDLLGSSVSLSGDTAALGAPFDDVNGNSDQGSVRVFVRSGSNWSQQATLTAADGAARDDFGYSVAISGNSVLIGSYLDDLGANSAQGSAYVFTRTGSSWAQQLQLTDPAGEAFDQFGIAVALSGDVALIGASFDDPGGVQDQGSALLFTRVDATWLVGSDAKLTPADRQDFDGIGSAVAISGDTAIIGAPFSDVNGGFDLGAAYVYVRSGSGWTQQAKLVAPQGRLFDFFGWSVAISGDTAVVGGYQVDDAGTSVQTNEGAAYVFVRSGGVWSHQATLKAPDRQRDDGFGFAVAIDGNSIFAAAPFVNGNSFNEGAVYGFTRSGATWLYSGRLVASDRNLEARFGSSLALANGQLIVGAPRDDSGGVTDRGAAYIFVSSGASWTEQAKIAPSDVSAFGFFGTSVSISGTTALIGAYADTVGGNSLQGSAYIMTRSGSTWNQQAKLTAPDGTPSDFFGHSVSISGDLAIIGAYADAIGANAKQGSAYVFARSGTTWSSLSKIMANDGRAEDNFGWGVAMTGTTVVVGAKNAAEPTGQQRGAAYVYDGALAMFPQARASAGGPIYPAAPDALSQAPNGSLVLTSLAWAVPGAIDAPAWTGTLTTSGPVRRPAVASTTLGGSPQSSLVASGYQFFGPLTLSSGSQTTFSGQEFRIGALGSLTVRGSGSVTISAPTVRLDGPVTLESLAFLDFSGNVAAKAFGSGLIAPGATVRIGQDFDAGFVASTRVDLRSATLWMRPSLFGITQSLELMSVDIGPSAAGLDRRMPGHFPIGSLRIGSSNAVVRLVDRRDNANNGQSTPEAIYVDTLRIDAGSRLINAAGKIYYNTLINSGTIDVPSNVIRLRPPCPSDLGGDGFVTDDDFQVFVLAYNVVDCGSVEMPVGCPADLNIDGRVDDLDFQIFAVAYDALLCP
jgi:hypothetical protein